MLNLLIEAFIDLIITSLLSGKRFGTLNDRIPGTETTLDVLISRGIFRVTSSLQLTCPFIWLYIMGKRSSNKFVRQILNITVGSTVHSFNPRTPHVGEESYWQEWQKFNAHFRVLRDLIEPGEIVSFASVHAGALWNSSPPSDKFVRSLVDVAVCTSQVSTKLISSSEIIRCESKNARVHDGEIMFLNAPSAKAGDAFCAVKVSLDGVLTGETILEVQQVKLYGLASQSLTKKMMADERAKSTNETDFMIILSTMASVSKEDIPPNTAVVVRSNFDEYYGPLAARAFYIANIPILSANKSPRSILQLARQIGTVRANVIIEEREIRPFSNIDDCHVRTKISKTILNLFAW